MSKIHIIHENEEWASPLFEELEKLKTPYESWFISHNSYLDIDKKIPDGLFYSRMSASSFTRGNQFSPELTRNLLAWLAMSDANLINGKTALELELSKLKQYTSLKKAGLKVPHTIATVSKDSLVQSAENLSKTPFIIKPNRGGKGIGVQKYDSISELKSAIENNEIGSSIDGIWLVQEYIKPEDSFITRLEFIDGKLYYAVRVDTSSGFELCPADNCETTDNDLNISSSNKFEIIKDYSNEDLTLYESFLRSNDISIASVEYVTDVNGNKWTYDVNTNTNYNKAAEAKTEYNAIKHLAEFITRKFNDTKKAR